MTTNYLEEYYKKIAELLHEIPNKIPYKFSSNEFQETNEDLFSNEILIEKRSYYTHTGTMDNIVLRIRSHSATCLGLHLISLALSMKSKRKSIVLENTESASTRLILSKPHFNSSTLLQIMPIEYNYYAADPSEFDRNSWALQEQAYELAYNLCFNLVDENGEFESDIDKRNILVIHGSCAGLILLAEYLLNLGLTKSKTNYINFGNDPNLLFKEDLIVSKDSCSGRLEMLK